MNKLYKHFNSSTVRCTFFADRVVNTWNKLPHPGVDFNSLTSFKTTIKMFTLLSFSFDFSFDFIVHFMVDLLSVLLILGIICICHLLGCVLWFKGQILVWIFLPFCTCLIAYTVVFVLLLFVANK